MVYPTAGIESDKLELAPSDRNTTLPVSVNIQLEEIIEVFISLTLTTKYRDTSVSRVEQHGISSDTPR